MIWITERPVFKEIFIERFDPQAFMTRNWKFFKINQCPCIRYSSWSNNFESNTRRYCNKFSISFLSIQIFPYNFNFPRLQLLPSLHRDQLVKWFLHNKNTHRIYVYTNNTHRPHSASSNNLQSILTQHINHLTAGDKYIWHRTYF